MLVLGANLTQDRVVRLPELVPGAVLRALSVDVAPGGKPVNVARVGAALGARSVLVANCPGATGLDLARELADAGLEVVPVQTDGDLRAATLLLESGGRTTVINEPGPPLDAASAAALLAAVDVALGSGTHRVVVLSGSLPPDTPDDLYAEAVRTAHRHGALALVDASGPALAAALEAGPDLVTPNLAEAESLLQGLGATGATELVDEEGADIDVRARAAAASLVRLGARAALVSGGRHGAALWADGRSWWFAAPSVVTVNAVGAGDSLLGGVAAGLQRGDPLVDAVRLGVAAAAVSVTRTGPGDVDAATVEDMLARVPAAIDEEMGR